MAKHYVTDAEMAAVAEAIRAKAGTEDKMSFPEGFVEGITNLPSGGDDDRFKALIEGTVTEITLPNDLTKIGAYAFYRYSTLTKCTIPSNVNQVGDYAFEYCTKLASLELNEGLHRIGRQSFAGCAYEELVIPESVEYIGQCLCQSASKVRHVKLPRSVMSMSTSYAFQYCSSLESVEFPKTGVTSFGTDMFVNCKKLKLYNSDFDGIETIEARCFSSCESLDITSLPSSLTRVEAYAFTSCIGLSELTFNSTPSYIAPSAFNNCTNLLTINVPWSEGAVSGAPWGATNATINYNYTGG